MRPKCTSAIGSLPLLLILLLLGCNTAFTSGIKDRTTSDPAAAPFNGTPPAFDTARASSPLWRASIWDAIPPKWLQGKHSDQILEAYQQNDWKPFFVNSRFELTEAARILMKRMERLEREAIDPRLFHLSFYKQVLPSLEKQRLALLSIDPELKDSHAGSWIFSQGSTPEGTTSNPKPVRYAMNSTTLPPAPAPSAHVTEDKWREIFRTASELDARLAKDLITLARELNPHGQGGHLAALTGAVPMARYLEELEPSSPHYKPLVDAYENYRSHAAVGKVPSSLGDAPLRVGDKGEPVRHLQKKLQAEGYYKGKVTGVFDAGTQEAVKSFQASHQVPPDGVVGNQTKAMLSTRNDEKALLIAKSLKLLRESQTRRFHDRYIRVNIPEFQLEYHKGGRIEAVHRVIVGKAGGKKIKVQGRMMSENNTPPLASTIERIVVNPRWYVSDRIRLELNDNLAADPSYFAKHGYVAMNSSKYPWGEPRIFQKPGPTNPLGQVKFEFPNAYAVFLHDTPKRQLFAKSRRDLSHGCIRVDKARELAARILSDDGNAAAEKLSSYYDTLRPTHINLKEPLPIVLEYIPVTTDGKGRLIFAGDIYGWFKSELQPGG